MAKVDKNPTIVLEYVPFDQGWQNSLILCMMRFGLILLKVRKYLMQLIATKHFLNRFLCQDNQLKLGFLRPSNQVGNKMVMKRWLFVQFVNESPQNFGEFPQWIFLRIGLRGKRFYCRVGTGKWEHVSVDKWISKDWVIWGGFELVYELRIQLQWKVNKRVQGANKFLQSFLWVSW